MEKLKNLQLFLILLSAVISLGDAQSLFERGFRELLKSQSGYSPALNFIQQYIYNQPAGNSFAPASSPSKSAPLKRQSEDEPENVPLQETLAAPTIKNVSPLLKFLPTNFVDMLKNISSQQPQQVSKVPKPDEQDNGAENANPEDELKETEIPLKPQVGQLKPEVEPSEPNADETDLDDNSNQLEEAEDTNTDEATSGTQPDNKKKTNSKTPPPRQKAPDMIKLIPSSIVEMLKNMSLNPKKTNFAQLKEQGNGDQKGKPPNELIGTKFADKAQMEKILEKLKAFKDSGKQIKFNKVKPGKPEEKAGNSDSNKDSSQPEEEAEVTNVVEPASVKPPKNKEKANGSNILKLLPPNFVEMLKNISAQQSKQQPKLPSPTEQENEEAQNEPNEIEVPLKPQVGQLKPPVNSKETEIETPETEPAQPEEEETETSNLDENTDQQEEPEVTNVVEPASVSPPAKKKTSQVSNIVKLLPPNFVEMLKNISLQQPKKQPKLPPPIEQEDEEENANTQNEPEDIEVPLKPQVGQLKPPVNSQETEVENTETEPSKPEEEAGISDSDQDSNQPEEPEVTNVVEPVNVNPPAKKKTSKVSNILKLLPPNFVEMLKNISSQQPKKQPKVPSPKEQETEEQNVNTQTEPEEIPLKPQVGQLKPPVNSKQTEIEITETEPAKPEEEAGPSDLDENTDQPEEAEDANVVEPASVSPPAKKKTSKVTNILKVLPPNIVELLKNITSQQPIRPKLPKAKKQRKRPKGSKIPSEPQDGQIFDKLKPPSSINITITRPGKPGKIGGKSDSRKKPSKSRPAVVTDTVDLTSVNPADNTEDTNSLGVSAPQNASNIFKLLPPNIVELIKKLTSQSKKGKLRPQGGQLVDQLTPTSSVNGNNDAQLIPPHIISTGQQGKPEIQEIQVIQNGAVLHEGSPVDNYTVLHAAMTKELNAESPGAKTAILSEQTIHKDTMIIITDDAANSTTETPNEPDLEARKEEIIIFDMITEPTTTSTTTTTTTAPREINRKTKKAKNWILADKNWKKENENLPDPLPNTPATTTTTTTTTEEIPEIAETTTELIFNNVDLSVINILTNISIDDVKNITVITSSEVEGSESPGIVVILEETTKMEEEPTTTEEVEETTVVPEKDSISLDELIIMLNVTDDATEMPITTTEEEDIEESTTEEAEAENLHGGFVFGAMSLSMGKKSKSKSDASDGDAAISDVNINSDGLLDTVIRSALRYMNDTGNGLQGDGPSSFVEGIKETLMALRSPEEDNSHCPAFGDILQMVIQQQSQDLAENPDDPDKRRQDIINILVNALSGCKQSTIEKVLYFLTEASKLGNNGS